MHIIIAAVVRLIAIRPQLNRFCMNGKIYARPKIWVSFVIHPTLRDESVGTTIKLCFEAEGPTSNISIDDFSFATAESTENFNLNSSMTATLTILQSILNTIVFIIGAIFN